MMTRDALAEAIGRALGDGATVLRAYDADGAMVRAVKVGIVVDDILAVVDPVLPDALRVDHWPLRTNPAGLHPPDPAGVNVRRDR